MKKLILFFVFLSGLLFFHETPIQADPAYWPTNGWKTSTPEKQGMNSKTLANMFERIKKQRLNIHSLLIIRNGFIVADAYGYPFKKDTPHVLYSGTKSIVSALVGIAINKGYIRDAQQPVLDFFKERPVANLDSKKKALRLEHLLTMTSGFAWSDGPDSLSSKELLRSADWIQHMLDLPMIAEPGTKFEYSNGDSCLLSAIVQQVTGKKASSFAQEFLFGPLGISDVTWMSNPQGVTIGYSRLWMKPHDMAKIGYLYLNKGFWDGRQLFSPEWIAASITDRFSTGYGYQWCLSNDKIFYYYATGWGGQNIFILPSLNMIVVFTAGTLHWIEKEFLNSFIVPAVESNASLPECPEGVALLESRIEALSNPEHAALPKLPETAAKISGKKYLFNQGLADCHGISLDFQQANASIKFYFKKDRLELPIGLDGVYQKTYVAKSEMFLPLLNLIVSMYPDIDRIIHETQFTRTGSVALRGFWESSKTFVLDEQIEGEAETLIWLLTFKDDKIEISLRPFLEGAYQTVVGTEASE